MDAADLLRVVALEGQLAPDPRRRLPGRGAHLHLDPGCLEAALRRRAFGRALRSAEPLDTEPLQRYVEERVARAPHLSSEPEAGRNE
ncbi:MAG: YlxR family protein [Actinomycetes bacterium]